tara:strand:+ start:534 stop:812 length:279 start_codon:yes stop_codon:yes gene_type:complete
MLQSKNKKMIPGQALIYERADGVVYARYRDPPHNSIPRWIIGGDPGAVARAQGELLDYSEWQKLCELAQTNKTLKSLMDKLVNTYYLAKENK